MGTMKNFYINDTINMIVINMWISHKLKLETLFSLKKEEGVKNF